MTLGQCINSYRIKNDMTMDAFAQKAHLTKAYISMLENGNKNRGGKRPAPSVETYKKCAFAMDISFDDLLRIVDDRISINPVESNFHTQLDEMARDLWVKQQLSIMEEYKQEDYENLSEEEQKKVLAEIVQKYMAYNIVRKNPDDDLTDAERTLLSCFRMLPEENQKSVLIQLEALAAAQRSDEKLP